MKYNIDAVFKSQFSPAAISVVVCNSNGILVNGITKHVWSYSSLAANAHVVLKTLRLGLAWYSRSIIYTIVSEILYAALINVALSPPSDIVAIVAIIWSLRSQLGDLSFKLIHQKGNRVVDVVAKLCLRNVLPSGWLVANPPELASVL